MEPPRNSQNSTCWKIQVSTDKVIFSRQKGEDLRIYAISNSLGWGSTRIYNELKPLNDGKSKAIQKGKDIETNRNEFKLLQKLNPHGDQVGISKPAKCFFEVPEWGASAQIMPKYKTDLRQMFWENSLNEEEAIEALSQVLRGLKFLREQGIFHGDIDERNVLFGMWKKCKRFDIADFEKAIDISQANTFDDLKALGVDITGLKPSSPYWQRFPEEERAKKIREGVHRLDLLKFKDSIVATLLGSCIVKNNRVDEMLIELFEFIPRAPSLDEVLDKVLEMQNELKK